MKPTVIDLFAGVGGLSLGFEMRGFNVLVANEYDKSIAAAYTENHKTTKMIVGDITKLNLEETFGSYKGSVDVVIGGPPCQGFSQKGQRKTIHDPRNFLFKYYVAVVELVKPKYFVMENVPNLLTAEGGFFLREIEELFNKKGYLLQYGVLMHLTMAFHKIDAELLLSENLVRKHLSYLYHRIRWLQYGMQSVISPIWSPAKARIHRLINFRQRAIMKNCCEEIQKCCIIMLLLSIHPWLWNDWHLYRPTQVKRFFQKNTSRSLFIVEHGPECGKMKSQ